VGILIKVLYRLALVFTLLLVLGCSNKNKENNKVTVKLAVGSSSPEETKLLDSLIALFEKENPKIRIKKQVVVGDYNEWLQISVAAGTAPDVTCVDVYLAKDYINYNAFLCLNKYFTKDELNAYYQNLLEGFTIDEKVYGIPKDFNTLVMFYNKDMFNAAGISSPPKTWNELDITLRKLKKAGKEGKLGKNFKYPMTINFEWNRVNPFIVQNGGATYENGKLIFNSQQSENAVDYVFSLMKNGYLAGPKEMGNPSSGANFGEGKTAIIYSGGWDILYLKEAAPNLNYGVAELPGNIKKGTTLYCIAYSILSKSEHPEEAVKLIKFLTGKQAEKMIADSGLAVPSRIDIAKYYTDKYPYLKPLAESAKFGTVFNWGKNCAIKNKELNDMLTVFYVDYTVGKKSLKAKPLLDSLLKKLSFSDK
jgi:multiple sugar transport system substrate-binding protein